MKRKELASLCKSARMELNLSQGQLAKKLNLPIPRISEFEMGRANLTCDNLLILLEALSLTITNKSPAKPTINQAAAKPILKPLNPIKQQPAKISLAEEMARLRSQ